MQEVARTKVCPRNKTFSQKQACHARKTVAAIRQSLHVPARCSLVCVDLNLYFQVQVNVPETG